ncbi:LytR/AlgR family response regulator transcription factor [Flavobacterium sp.]|uniref:LytR/AlgR family response regulator transcription factor n=1 Tax=Flavobacterium sp. TaxID=239 RepID=UPI003C443D4C
MNYSYVIIDDNQENVLETKAVANGFSELSFVGSANNYEEGLNLILEYHPQLIFLEIDPTDKNSNISLLLINELYRFLKIVPKIIVITKTKDLAFEAIQYGVSDYIIKPVSKIHLVKTILKLEKSNPIGVSTSQVKVETPTILEKVTVYKEPLVLCIKSYGDHRYIDTRDIAYLQADNNSTDIYLSTGEMITAFKTLKHFELVLEYPFVRIHNSYIVNSFSISRIHTGNSVCYIKNSAIKLPFSKSYKINIDLIIAKISNGNYLEI